MELMCSSCAPHTNLCVGSANSSKPRARWVMAGAFIVDMTVGTVWGWLHSQASGKVGDDGPLFRNPYMWRESPWCLLSPAGTTAGQARCHCDQSDQGHAGADRRASAHQPDGQQVRSGGRALPSPHIITSSRTHPLPALLLRPLKVGAPLQNIAPSSARCHMLRIPWQVPPLRTPFPTCCAPREMLQIPRHRLLSAHGRQHRRGHCQGGAQRGGHW